MLFFVPESSFHVPQTFPCLSCKRNRVKRIFLEFSLPSSSSIKRGIAWIKKKQRSDGSWYLYFPAKIEYIYRVGNWAVCVSYAMWYIIDALMYIGQSPNEPYIKKACQYLASKQRADGGWGESFQVRTENCESS
jgi:squalene cyclase